MRKFLITAVAFILFTSSIQSQHNQGKWKISFVNKLEFKVSENTFKKIHELTWQAENELKKLLPLSDSISIIITIDSVNVIQETGNSGFPLAKNKISWTVDPTNLLGLDSIIYQHYKSTLYHECNHLARNWTSESSRKSNNFMDAVIAEGLATCFEKAFASKKPLWAQYNSGEIEGWVEELLQLQPSAYSNYYNWMFKHQDGRKWVGYKAGTYIVEKAMLRSKLSLSELTILPTKDILRLAGY